MASYPVAPEWKVQYHEDNSAGFLQYNSGGAIFATLNSGQMNGLNAETQFYNVVTDNDKRIGFIFPVLMDIVGVFMNNNGSDGTGTLRTSTDTTNGVDGTWTTVTTTLPIYGGAFDYRWRTNIQPVTLTGIRALTLFQALGGGTRNIHIYGLPAAGEAGAVDRLIFWDPTLSQMLAPATFDFGDQPRNTTTTRTFRIKNNSSTLTANGIVLSAAANSAASPSLQSQTTFSSDGTTFTASPNVGNLAPGAVSGTLHVRLALTTTAQLAPCRQRIKAAATTWT